MDKTSLDTLLDKKRKTKKALCDKLSIDGSGALLGIVLDKKLSKSEKRILRNIIEGAEHINVNVVILTDTSLFNPGKIPHLEYSRENRHKLLEASDMSLIFSFSDVQEILLNGTVPISPNRKEIADYDPNRETGNGFVYKENDHWCAFATLVRAVETFRFPYDWTNIVKKGVSSVDI
jgi:hypothetical protein